jgi:glycosyltransferase involved in cell wall biosynthesis
MMLAIVPAYNEAARIANVVSSLRTVVDVVVVVDDASKDDTATRASTAGAVVLRHRINRGQGAALETGHAYARMMQADIVIHFDGDGQFDVADILPAVEALTTARADILFGSRFLLVDALSGIPPFKRYVLLPIARHIDRIFGAVPLSDAHNGFRVLSKYAIETICIRQDRMAHATEIPQQVGTHHLSYIEFPVRVSYHEYGQSSIAGIKIITDLLLNRF